MMIRIAVTKGRVEKDFCKLLEEAKFNTEDIKMKGKKLLVKTNDNIEIVFAKSADVLNFINKGLCDLGVVGKDVLQENESDDYEELLDLKVGKCYFALAGYPECKNNIKRIATKYPNITKNYFNSKQKDVEIVKMEGSVELGPIVGMSDAIVDIVETGSTLNANRTRSDRKNK